MKGRYYWLLSSFGLLLLVGIILCAGCATSTGSTTGVSQTTNSIPVPMVSSGQSAGGQSTLVNANKDTQSSLTTANLANGITITYPSDWTKDTPGETGDRDYGRTTKNIVNFYSPDVTPERQEIASGNPDKSKYTVVSIDVDEHPISDFEDYFNKATIAVQDTYGTIEITKHNYQMKISGYKTYELDFDTVNTDKPITRHTLYFTNVDGTMYIVSVKNPSPYSKEVMDMIKSMSIKGPKVTEGKQRY